MDPLEPHYRVCPTCGHIKPRAWILPILWEDKICVVCGTSMRLVEDVRRAIRDAEDLQKIKGEY